MRDSEITKVLKHSRVFASLNERELSRLQQVSTLKRLRTGTLLLHESTVADCFYVLIEGRLKVFSHLRSGRVIILTFIGPGEVAGPFSALCSKPCVASVQAVDVSTVLEIDVGDLELLIMESPAIALLAVKILAAAGRHVFHRLVDLASMDVVERICKTLRLVSARQMNEVHLSREELAWMAGSTVETVIRVTSCLQREGVVTCGTRKIVILDEAKLRLISEGRQHLSYYPCRGTAAAICGPPAVPGQKTSSGMLESAGVKRKI